MLKLKYKMSRILRTIAREGGAFNVNNKILHFDLPAYDGQYRNLAKHHLVLQFDPDTNKGAVGSASVTGLKNYGFGGINSSHPATQISNGVYASNILEDDIEFYDNKAIFRNVWLESSKKGRLAYEQYVNILNANLNKYKYDIDDEKWLSLWGNKLFGVDNTAMSASAGISQIGSSSLAKSPFADLIDGQYYDNGAYPLIIPLSDLMDIASCDAMSCDEFGDLTVGIELESIIPVIAELHNPNTMCFTNVPVSAYDFNNYYTNSSMITTVGALDEVATLTELAFSLDENNTYTFDAYNAGTVRTITVVGDGVITAITGGGAIPTTQCYTEWIFTKNGIVQPTYKGVICCSLGANDKFVSIPINTNGVSANNSTFFTKLDTDGLLDIAEDDYINSSLQLEVSLESVKLKPLTVGFWEYATPLAPPDNPVSLTQFRVPTNGALPFFVNQKVLLSSNSNNANQNLLTYSARISAIVLASATAPANTCGYALVTVVYDATGHTAQANAPTAQVYIRPMCQTSPNDPLTQPIDWKTSSMAWSINKAEMVEVITSMNESTRSMFEQNVGMCSRFYRSYKVEPFLMTDTLNFVRQFQIEPETVACMLLTPTGTGSNTRLISKQDGVVSYTVVLDGMQTTNRDITLLQGNGIATGAIHQDRLLKTMEEMGVEVKQLQELNQKLVVYPERIQLLEKFNPNGQIRTIQFNLNSDGTNLLKGKMVYLFKSILKSL
jgi:hypothetical protein